MPTILAYGLGILSGMFITIVLAVVFYVLAATRGDDTEYLPPEYIPYSVLAKSQS